MADLGDANEPNLNLCEAVQIALEMDARGALAAARRARLETHLAGCENCRVFRRVQLATDAALREVLVRESGSGTEADSRAFVARMRRLQRLGRLFVPAVTALTVGGLLAGDWIENGAIRHPREMCAVAALCLLPGLALYYWRRHTLTRLLAGDDVVATHRRLLRDALRVQVVGCALWAAALPMPLVVSALDPTVWQDPIARVALPVSAVLALVALIAGVIRVMELRRQLARMR